MKNKKIIFALLTIIVSLSLIVSRPLWIIGNYSMAMSSLLYITFMLGSYFFVALITKKEPIIIFGLIAGMSLPIFVPVISLFWFDTAKIDHLRKHGEIVKAVIIKKNKTWIPGRRRGIHTFYSLSFKFEKHDGEIVKSWESVLEYEYDSFNKHDNVDLIYSKRNSNTFDLILSNSEYENYTKLTNNQN